MKTHVTAFLIFNLLLVLANLVGAGLLLLAYKILGDEAGIIAWLAAALLAIGGALIFGRGAFYLLQNIVAKPRGKPP